MNPEKIEIFDTTLRDGTSPGMQIKYRTKISHCRKARRIGVDIIEAGLISSPDFLFVYRNF
jgi:2-isopropylmalate synthase